MKISINNIRTTMIPVEMGFNLCVFGQPNEEIQGWIDYHNFETMESGKFTNIILPEDVVMKDIFEEDTKYKYVDGFSPNLNKHLHIGHFSNLVLANSLQSMGIGESNIAIMGDTLDGDVTKAEAWTAYQDLCKDFNYKVETVYMASKMEYFGDKLVDGTDKYEGTKVFEIGDEKIVGLKSDGSTTYFYQDVALASHLDGPTLYLTGNEQDGHFNILNKMFPGVNHLGLGLVTLNGKKASSRDGNVIYITDVMDMLMEKFDNNKELVYNVFAGQILKSLPKSNKEIKTKDIDNPKNSEGLYLSYTLARLKSAGVIYEEIDDFLTNEFKFVYLKAKTNLAPNLLFSSLVTLCKKINGMYGKYKIQDNEENQKLFIPLIQELDLGMKKLGMFTVDKV